MKLNKDELKQKISDKIKDNDDLVIELLEDIDDSFVVENENVINETLKKEKEDLEYKYEDLKARYKERFLNNEPIKTNDEEIEEKKIIDVKEI